MDKKPLTAMHICYLAPDLSGYETRVVEEVGLLGKLGIKVIIACFVARKHFFPKELYIRLKKATGARVYIIPTTHFFDLSVPQEGAKSISWPLVTLAKLHDVDILHGQALYSSMHALRVKNRIGAKVVFDVHGASPEESEMSGAHASRVNKLTEWEKEALNTADFRIFVSNRMKEFFKEKYGITNKPSVLIPCCVHSDKFRMTDEERQDKRKQLGITDKFVVMYLGTLSAWQWPEAMFSLFSQFQREKPDSLFYLLLPSSDHDKAKSFLHKHCISDENYRVEEVPHSEVGQVIGVADAGLLLRKSHPVNLVSSPTKFGEYLAAGVPVIATAEIGDTSGLLKAENVGLIVSASDEGVGLEDIERLVNFATRIKASRAAWGTKCADVASIALGWTQRGSELAGAYRGILKRDTKEEMYENEQYPDKYIAQPGPIFIGGTGRSGTTLVAWMLDKHIDVATIKWESHFIVDEVGLINVVEKGPAALPAFLDRMKGFWFRREVKNINRPSYWAGLVDDIPEGIFMGAATRFEKDIQTSGSREERLQAARDMIDTIMTSFLEQRQKARWAEKTPKNILLYDFLLELYPEAKLVNCIRDGRDVVASMVERQIWPIQANRRVNSTRRAKLVTVENASFYWKEHIMYARHLSKLYPNSYFELKYEALLTNPAHEILRLSKFLFLQPSEDMLNYDLNKSSMGRWKKQFTTHDKETFKQFAGDMLIELGYEKDNNW